MLTQRASTTGITEPQHAALDTLTHDIAETSYYEVTRTGNLITTMIWWTNSGKTIKIREVSITRSGNLASIVTTKQYDGSGVLKNTYTETITRSGNLVSSIAGVYT